MTSHIDVASNWVRGLKRGTRGFNVFFDGDTIYSYGRHFPIARFAFANGVRYVLFTSEGYSVSTAKHKTLVRRALHRLAPDTEVFDVPVVGMDQMQAHVTNYRDICARSAEARRKGRRAKVYGGLHEAEAQRLDAMAYAYAMAFDIPELGYANAA